MAEQKKLPIPALPQTAYTTKQGKRRKTLEEKREAKRAASRRRQESCRTRVYIGAAFDRWKNLKDSKGLKSDAELALLLLDSYERGCPVPTHGQRLPSRGSRSAPDRDQAQAADVQPLNGNSPAEETGLYQVEVSVDWDDDTWEEETHEGVPLTSSEEDLTLEVNSEDDEDSDEEYVHPVCVRPAGALNTELCLRDGGDDSGSGPDPAADVHVIEWTTWFFLCNDTKETIMLADAGERSCQSSAQTSTIHVFMQEHFRKTSAVTDTSVVIKDSGPCLDLCTTWARGPVQAVF